MPPLTFSDNFSTIGEEVVSSWQRKLLLARRGCNSLKSGTSVPTVVAAGMVGAMIIWMAEAATDGRISPEAEKLARERGPLQAHR
jgi:hypothetical protein